jgi:hypothetical protein
MWNGAATQECGEEVFAKESLCMSHATSAVLGSTPFHMSKWRFWETVHAFSLGYSPWTREERLIGLAITDLFSPDQRMRRGEPPIE